MLISELEAQLKSFREKHGDLLVFPTWEGVFTDINSVYRSKPGIPFNADEPDLVTTECVCVLDVEAYYDADTYRKDFEHPDDRPKPQP